MTLIVRNLKTTELNVFIKLNLKIFSTISILCATFPVLSEISDFCCFPLQTCCSPDVYGFIFWNFKPSCSLHSFLKHKHLFFPDENQLQAEWLLSYCLIKIIAPPSFDLSQSSVHNLEHHYKLSFGLLAGSNSYANISFNSFLTNVVPKCHVNLTSLNWSIINECTSLFITQGNEKFFRAPWTLLKMILSVGEGNIFDINWAIECLNNWCYFSPLLVCSGPLLIWCNVRSKEPTCHSGFDAVNEKLLYDKLYALIDEFAEPSG